MHEFMLLENGASHFLCVCGVFVVYLWYVYDVCMWSVVCICMHVCMRSGSPYYN